ncbi:MULTISPECIES: sigma-54-dependent transcriptional regulator [Flavobacteriales]|uniref:Response regulator with CheY-like receiver, AAA-type ATPase, and DNA-binding domains n=1 Tax=Owenweeksia hongkongensis (strain DSM 17368 / CIP 108786 / JCM 12287 / NRRL B-23963 / UST20020801) TaxID=926562 RepID=G8R515_OWEHD|nr:sigma-54 dependent transcriptional regulator [Owenweeksia hongkongensis]AEV34329.1 response regulator with CheY-like receiver, AAA-type ATPase, and DNA-binding domains [Owenweeksia hongkongensis DSM 17368]
MNGFKIFIVDDNELYAKASQHHLSLNPDNEVESFSTGKDCINNLYTKPNMIFLDYSLPDMSGIEVLRKIKQSYPETPVVIVSGQEDVSTAVELLKEGAYDYIVKDENAHERMWKSTNNIRENFMLRDEIDKLREEVDHKYDFSNIKGNSLALKKVYKLIEKASQTNITVSITGETGTGKELVAKAIHYNNKNKQKRPLVAVNIAAIPRDLLESELFGHEKGAFTGASNRRIGKFEEAIGGTIFLDEIGEMDLNLQAKLLRVLQEKEVTRIGSNTPVKVNARVLVATHKTLAEEVKAGRFREDLYYRLLGLPIELPPLRDRGNDIVVLAKHFIDDFASENDMGKLHITADAQKKLLNYDWPGNVRELKAVVELASVLCDDGKITDMDINFNSTNNGLSELMSKELTLKGYNIKIIQHFLDKYERNVVDVAKKLDIGKSTIYRMVKNNELEI